MLNKGDHLLEQSFLGDETGQMALDLVKRHDQCFLECWIWDIFKKRLFGYVGSKNKFKKQIELLQVESGEAIMADGEEADHLTSHFMFAFSQKSN